MKQCVIWCDLNSEQETLEKMLKGRCISIYGSLSDKDKEERLRLWLDKKVEIMITKPSIFGFGLNLQQCYDQIFVGLSDSFESYYQAVRRCWRFGQKNPVNVHIITSELEGNVVANIRRKEQDAERMAESMVEHMSNISSSEIKGVFRTVTKYEPTQSIQIPQFMRAA